MATQTQRVSDALYHLATQLKATRMRMNGNALDNSALATAQKSNLIDAINEIKAGLDALATAAVIDDVGPTSGNKTWSSSKIDSQITAALNALTTGAPGALNTLDELAAALGDDANFAASMTSALSNRVRLDTPTQGLTITQQANARANIAAFGLPEIGDPDTDLVAVVTAALGA
jgi:hypothetical protein